jgi:hypothetical protein
MADTKQQSSPILVILCALGLIAFMFLVIYPNYRSMQEYDRQISLLNEEIAMRQSLAPIYGKLIEKVHMAPSMQLKSPEKTMVDIKDAGRLTRIFQDIAQTAGLALESVIPDAQAFEQRNGRLTVDVVFSGQFLNVRPLIHTIVEQSFVDRIERIQVKNADADKWVKLSVSLNHR